MTGRDLRDAGMVRVELAENAAYRARFLAAAEELASSGRHFTAETVTGIVGLPAHPNVVGALLNGLARRGEIVAVGYRQAQRTERHASRMLVWRGTTRSEQEPNVGEKSNAGGTDPGPAPSKAAVQFGDYAAIRKYVRPR
jgi:hypothetical protein